MTDLDRRLADALSAREREITVDDDAWQTHLDLVRGRDGVGTGRAVLLGRWRAPALVAASVVAVGLVGGLIAQNGLLGSHPVSPAGSDSGVSTPVSTGPSHPTHTGAASTRQTLGSTLDGGGVVGPVSSPAGPVSVADTAAPPRSGDAPTRTVPTSEPAAPPRVSTSAPPAPIELTTEHAPSTTAVTSSPSSVRSTVADVVDLPTAGDAGGSGPQQMTMIDLAGLIPCGAQLPDLSKITTAITVEAGPNAAIVNSDKQALPVLAVGYTVVDGDGRIASSTGGDGALQKTTASTLPGGRSDHQASILPTGLCASTSGPNATTAIQQRLDEPATNENDSLIFQVGLSGALPTGTYSAVNVVLVGDDLAHARAYRSGPVWQFTTG